MRASKGFKYQNREYGSKSFEIELTHEELGLPTPTSPEECREVAAQLSYELEALRVIEEVREGLVPADLMHEKLRIWLPTTSTSSTTEQD